MKQKILDRPLLARIFENRLTLFFILLGIESFFFVTNGLNSVLREPTEGIELKINAIDNHLVPGEIWLLPYTIGIFLPALLPFWAAFHMPNKLFRQFVLALGIAAVVSYVVYVIYPTYVIKPAPQEVTGDGVFAEWLRSMYEMDNAYSTHNAAPSQHVFYAIIAMCFMIRFRPTSRVFFTWTTLATLITVSALFTRQHHSPDLIAGYIVAVASYWIGLWAGHHITAWLGDEHDPIIEPSWGSRQRRGDAHAGYRH